MWMTIEYLWEINLEIYYPIKSKVQLKIEDPKTQMIIIKTHRKYIF